MTYLSTIDPGTVNDFPRAVKCHSCAITGITAPDSRFYVYRDPNPEDLQDVDALIKKMRSIGEKQICETCVYVRMHQCKLTPERLDDLSFVTLKNLGRNITEKGLVATTDLLLHQPARPKVLLAKLACIAFENKNFEIAINLAKKLTQGSLSSTQREWIVEIVAEVGCTEAFRKILDAGVSSHKRAFATFKAVSNGHVECLKLLLEADDISEWVRGNLAWAAAVGGHVGCLKLLLEAGIDELTRHLIAVGAIGRSDLECLKVLLENGTEERSRVSLASIAIHKGHVGCLKLLLEAGIDKSNRRGLALGAEKGQEECLALLRNTP